MFKRIITLAVTVCAATGFILAVPAAAQTAKPAVQPGMRVSTDGKYFCSLGPIGTDAFGNTVALIAGHCQSELSVPVFMCNSQALNSSCNGVGTRIGRYTDTPGAGWVRGTGATSTDWSTDYAVIVIDTATVQPSNVTPRGLVIRSAGGPVANGTQACKDGMTTGKTCGSVDSTFNGQLRTYVKSNNGDSGGPLVVGDRVVGLFSNFRKLFGFINNGPWNYITVDGILSQLAARDSIGRGFVPIP